jgi:hypothetical protein
LEAAPQACCSAAKKDQCSHPANFADSIHKTRVEFPVRRLRLKKIYSRTREYYHLNLSPSTRGGELVHHWGTSKPWRLRLVSQGSKRYGIVDKINKMTRKASMTTSSTPEGTVAECKRRVDECNALLKNTIVPEYRHALMAMAKAWMKIAHIEEQNR